VPGEADREVGPGAVAAEPHVVDRDRDALASRSSTLVATKSTTSAVAQSGGHVRCGECPEVDKGVLDLVGGSWDRRSVRKA
jgi:hypothetical protein